MENKLNLTAITLLYVYPVYFPWLIDLRFNVAHDTKHLASTEYGFSLTTWHF